MSSTDDTLNNPAASATAAPDGATGSPDAAASAAQADDRYSTAGQRAVRAAMAASAGEDPQNRAPAQEQAGNGTPGDGAEQAGSAAGAAAGAQAATAAADSTAITAPADWPADRRAAFDAMPPEARTVALGFYKDMQAGFTHAMQGLAGERQRLGELAKTAEAFESDPKTVLQKLAAQKGIPLWFEAPAAADEVPDFDNPAEMAKWASEQAHQRMQRELAEQRQAEDRQRTAAEADRALREELAAAQKAHADFGTHQARIFDLLARAPGLSVSEAYGLATLDGLRQMAVDGQTAQRELAALKAEVERSRKALTAPVAGAEGNGQQRTDLQNLSPAQRAVRAAVIERQRAAG